MSESFLLLFLLAQFQYKMKFNLIVESENYFLIYFTGYIINIGPTECLFY